MIAYIDGTVLKIEENALILLVGGIGVRVNCTRDLVIKAHVGERIHLYTHLVVREDALTLYGFENEDQREMFDLLLGVNSVGPRTALNVLSSMEVDAIRRAVLSETPAGFSKIPGVGTKTAQKIVLFLQGKIKGELVPGMSTGTQQVDMDVLEALTGLGYSVIEAQAAIQFIPGDVPLDDVEASIRAALRFFN